MATPTNPLETTASAALKAGLADRYRIERELGAGGMATVYLAHDLRHDRDVAIKVLHPELGAALGVERFLSEIRTTARLQHPNIVPVFDSGQVPEGHPESTRTAGEASSLLFFVMPRIEGETLRDRLERDGRLPVGDAVRLVREAAEALDYAHAQGILHRDLKPENILLSRGHALLADFGIAGHMATPDTQRLTQTGTSLGTPAYMSPEQCTGERTLGPPSDVYALGAILFELLTGAPPFTGPTYEAILVQRFTQDPPRCVTRRPDTPRECDAAIARALERDPADRFATAHEFAAALGTAETQASPRTDGPSIAVLPFANVSADPENGYFADGLTEEVILTLSKVQALRVSSRTSVMQYRGRTDAPREIAHALGVTHLLEGSVRKAGNRLRITASLLDAERDASLWSERFDGTLDNVFDMQDRVAESIVSALRLTLSGEERARLVEHPIENAAAYDAYLRAREGINAFTATGLRRALGHLEEAAQLAPDNVFVIRGMARACWAAINSSVSSDLSLLDDALRHADTIARLEPGSPFVSEIHGLVAAFRGDLDTALRELGVAYEAIPNDADVAFWYGAFLMFADRVEAGLAVLRDLTRRDPTYALAPLMEDLGEGFAGRFAAPLARLAEGPRYAPPAIWYLVQGLVGLAAGDQAHALRAFDLSAAEPRDAMSGLSAFLAAATRGDAADAAAILTPELEAFLWHDFTYTEYAAQGFALLGDVPEIGKWLLRAADLGAGYYGALSRHNAVWRPWLAHANVAPIFERIRANAARYAAIPLAPRARTLAGGLG